MKKKILLSAYAISPFRGSEYGVAWNTVVNLSQQHELWVLYGMSDNYMGDTQTMKKYLKDNPMPSVEFIEVQPGHLAKAITLLDKVGLGWCFYFAYYLWQKQALAAARQIIATVNIDVVHQLGPIGFREPGLLWKLGKPLVWGPIGGIIFTDKKLLTHKKASIKLKFYVKKIINHVQLNSKRIKKAFEKADVLIAATKVGQRVISEKFNRESYYLPEVAILNTGQFDESRFRNINRHVQLVWSGSHIERKNMELCLDALAGVRHTNWTLNILGHGPLTKKLQDKATKLNLTARINWHGHLKRADAIQIMSKSHLHLITSIAEDNTTVVFEAMSYNVPTLTIDHCGMSDVICEKCGIKIQIDGYAAMVSNMSNTLNDLLANPAALVKLAYGTVPCAEDHHWDKRLSKLNDIYDQAMHLHGTRFNRSPIQTTITA